MMRPFVVYWNNIPAPYMVERFNALADRGFLDFEAWFNDRIQADRSWEVSEDSWRFSYRFLPGFGVLGKQFRLPTPVLRRQPDLLVCLYERPAFVAGWALARLIRSKTVFWVVRTSDRWVTRKWIKERLKHWMFPRLDGIVTPGSDGRMFAQTYGAPDSKIFSLPHSIDVNHFNWTSLIARSEREILRQSLGVKGTVFQYVGRLKQGKGLYCLLDAFGNLQAHNEQRVSLILVGDGPEEEGLRRYCTELGLHNVVFTGFKHKEELPRYYATADVFVFPTLGDPYGLVVDEAMACGMPVIATSAAGEIQDRVKNGVNGYVIPPKDPEALTWTMQNLANNPLLRSSMGVASRQMVQGRTPEKWAEQFESIAQYVLKNG
jgi:glycosyltransferase involved in cell wall biosynthesis